MATKKTEKPDASDDLNAVENGVALVRMVKGDEALDVHPSCVAAHKTQGWKEG